MGQGGHSEPFLLLALFYQSTPSCLKVRGGWGGWVVAHVILVSAQVPLVLTLGLWDLTWGLWDFGLGLDNVESLREHSVYTGLDNDNVQIQWQLVHKKGI